MDYKVLYTQNALTDLAEIMAWSWEKHPETSERFAQALLDHVDFLGRFPNIGVSVEGHPGVRCLSHSPLQVFYRIREEKHLVEILHFWHGSRKPPRF